MKRSGKLKKGDGKKLLTCWVGNGELDKDGLEGVIKLTEEISTDYVKMYRGCFYRIAQLNGCPRDLVEYLASVMSSSNKVYNNKDTRSNFMEITNRARKLNGKEGYSESTVTQAFHTLKQRGFLIEESKGIYSVTPMLFWTNESEKKRHENIIMRLKFEHDKPPVLTVDRSGNFKRDKGEV